MVEFTTLGSLVLRQRDGPVVRSVLAQPKRTAILAYLLLARPYGYHRRDELVSLFWPDADTAHGRNSLRQALHFIRRSLGETVIDTAGEEAVAVAEGAVWCDAREFELAAARGDPEAALALYQGELLPGLFVEGSAEFEHWLELERARIRRIALNAALEAAESRERAGDLARAAEFGARAVALAPGDQSALRLQMARLERKGDRAEAIAYYEQQARYLLTEYELEPDAETRQLADEIRARNHGALPAPPEEPKATSLPPAPAPALTPVPPPASKRRGPLRLNAHRGAALLGGAALLATVLMVWPAARAPAVKRTVVVGDCANLTPDSALGYVITLAVRTNLAPSKYLHVLDDDEVRTALRLMQRAPGQRLDPATTRELAQREGTDVILECSVGAAGSGYVLNASAISTDSLHEIATFQTSARNPEQLIDALLELSDRIRHELGEPHAAIRDTPPLERVATNNLEALRRWTLAREALAMTDQGPGAERLQYWNQFVALAREAMALDTMFATAYRGLGLFMYHRATISDDRDLALESLSYMTRAFELRERLPLFERYLTEGTYYRYVVGDRQKAINAFTAALAVGGRGGPLQHLGGLYNERHEFARAEQVWRERIAMVKGATPNPMNMNLAFALAGQGKWPQVRAVFEQRDFWNGVGCSGYLAAEYVIAGARAADSAAVQLRKRFPANVALEADRAMLAALSGRLSVAERYFGAQERGTSSAVPLAELDLYVRGDVVAARKHIDTLLVQLRSGALRIIDAPLATIVEVLARNGEVATARSLLAAYDQLPAPARALAASSDYIEAARGAVALAEQRPADAVARYRAASAEVHCNTCLHPLLGRAYEQAGMPDSALRAYEVYLARGPAPIDVFQYDMLFLPFVLERTADLYERRGQRAQAMAAYRRLVQTWEHADAELQPRVQHARRRLQALARETVTPL